MASSKDIYEADIYAAGMYAAGIWRGIGVDVAAPSVPGAEFKLTRPVTQYKLSPPANQMKVKEA